MKEEVKKNARQEEIKQKSKKCMCLRTKTAERQNENDTASNTMSEVKLLYNHVKKEDKKVYRKLSRRQKNVFAEETGTAPIIIQGEDKMKLKNIQKSK